MDQGVDDARMPAKGRHALRHTFCSQLAARGVQATEIQRLAGHDSITTTQRYMQVGEERLTAAVMALDGGYAEDGNASTVAAGGALLGQDVVKRV
jgi:integrase